MNCVLVTGLPRSGTTFLGRVLAMPRQVAYVHEPLNMQCGLPGVTKNFIPLADPEWSGVADEMAAMLELRGTLRGAVYPEDSFVVRSAKRLVGGRGPAHLILARVPPRPQHVVVKDPFAFWSIDWFEAQGCHALMMIRHPAAMVGSFRRLGWTIGGQLSWFRRNPDELDDVELEWLDRIESDLDEIALYWRIAHRLALPKLRTGSVVVHEQLSRDPVEVVGALRTATGLPSSAYSDRQLRRLTSGAKGAADPSGRTQQFRRASSEILSGTIATLTDDEVDRIWDIAGDVATRWYGPTEVR